MAGKRFNGYGFYTKVANGVESNYKQQNQSLVDLETMTGNYQTREVERKEKVKYNREEEEVENYHKHSRNQPAGEPPHVHCALSTSCCFHSFKTQIHITSTVPVHEGLQRI